jgi:hypothetical protein
MVFYLEDMDICGNAATPDDDDVSSMGNSLHRYVDSDVDGMKERIHVLGLSAQEDSLTADLDVSLIQTPPPGSQPDPLNKYGDESKGWFILPCLCLPRWIRRAPTWLQVLVIASLMLLIIAMVIAGIALGEIKNDSSQSSQSNAILGVPGYIPTPSPITMGFSPTVNVQDQINEPQPTSSPSSPLESGPNTDFSPTNNIQDQIENSPQLGVPSTSPESGTSVSTTATAAEDSYLVGPPTSAPTTYPTQFPSTQHVNASSAPSSPATAQLRSSSAPSTHPTQPMDTSSAPSSLATMQLLSSSSAPTTYYPTQLPSVKPVDASSAPSSLATMQLLSSSSAPTTYYPTQLPSVQPVDASSAPSSPAAPKIAKIAKVVKQKRRNIFRPPPPAPPLPLPPI